MNILFLEPFFAGSHEYFARGIQAFSSHTVDLCTLPGRFWKWRMRGASLEFHRTVKDREKYDLILAGNMMDLAQWKALNPDLSTPLILYVHENQLAYPVKEGEVRDFQYGWTDYTNMLCADSIIFNSAYNRDSFFSELKELIGRLPDCKPDTNFSSIQKKISIIAPGCRLPSRGDNSLKLEGHKDAPLIIWNHRWEHDKNPEEFFEALSLLRERGIPFRLALLGESYKNSPSCFQEARELFRDELIHFGYCESRGEYESWLKKADFVISTAIQENFGISVVEAVSAGAIPLLPARLAYPEVLPGQFHKDLLFNSLPDFTDKMTAMIGRSDISLVREDLSRAMQCYSWVNIIRRFDRLFEETLNQYGK